MFFKKKKPIIFEEKRASNLELDAQAIARGLKRRREDRLNELFYFGVIGILVTILSIFIIGSFYI